jgi:hypothetical protein
VHFKMRQQCNVQRAQGSHDQIVFAALPFTPFVLVESTPKCAHQNGPKYTPKKNGKKI